MRALGEQLTRVLAQKEALADTLVARVAAVEAVLAEKDPAPALARLAERLAALETAENPFAEISEQLTRLYAQKDATVETVFARLAPLEARLAALDPTSALDRFAERLEAVQGRVATLESAENPFAEISEQLTRLYARRTRRWRRCSRGWRPWRRGWPRSTRRRRSTASPSGSRRCRAGWRRSKARRTRSRRSPSS